MAESKIPRTKAAPALELTDAQRRINAAFSNMRFSGSCRFTPITKDDTAEEIMENIATNLETLGGVITRASDKATANERTLTHHHVMFRALGDLMTEVEAIRKAN